MKKVIKNRDDDVQWSIEDTQASGAGNIESENFSNDQGRHYLWIRLIVVQKYFSSLVGNYDWFMA